MISPLFIELPSSLPREASVFCVEPLGTVLVKGWYGVSVGWNASANARGWNGVTAGWNGETTGWNGETAGWNGETDGWSGETAAV
jgi:hypothetical protein